MAQLEQLYQNGQSPWLNYLRRAFIESGELKDAVETGIGGITSTPLIFEKAILSSSDYDEAIRELVSQGMPVKEIYEALVADDIQRAADVLHSVFETTKGKDGYVSLELNPSLAHDATGTVAEARHVLHEVNRPNAMVEVPATEAGITALEALINDGTNVNATHIFSLEAYRSVAEAYLRGIEKYIQSHSVWRQNPVSLASFSLSKIDQVVDGRLDELGRPELKGKTGIALAKSAYGIFQEMFSGPDWQRLTQRDAYPQRLKWTRTRPLDFEYRDTYYVEELIGPETVVTLSQATLNAFQDHGTVNETLTLGLDQARAHLDELRELGIDLDEIGRKLQNGSLAAFDAYFQRLIESVIKKRDQLDYGWRRMEVHLGDEAEEVDNRLAQFCEDGIMCRIWAADHTVWKPEPEEIVNRMGWLHIVEYMRENIGRLERFLDTIHEGSGRSGPFDQAVVLGMGGSSLAARLFADVFGKRNLAGQSIDLAVLDTTDPDVIADQTSQLELEKTLFIVSSKSGGTVETLSNFRYFYGLVGDQVGFDRAGDHFVAITDPGTKLAEIATEHHFLELFLNDPTIGGRYSALSYFGLVPAALVGVDLENLLDRAFSMVVNAHSCNCPMKGDNAAAQLGTIMGYMAKQGRDKLTIITSPSLEAFAGWTEQLIAESTGKEGRGIVPVVGETVGSPRRYADDRVFVYLRLDGEGQHDQAVDHLVEAGFPLVTFHLRDIYDLGGMFFTWEMATAVAGYYLQIQPFNQPNVEAAKQLARRMVSEYREEGVLPELDARRPSAGALEEFLEQARSGDYIALLAYVSPMEEIQGALRTLRTSLRDKYRLATTLGYGPSYLHSTGQMHKGDGGSGLFILLSSDPEADIPIPNSIGEQGSDISFGILRTAQAVGDARALLEQNRRLIHFHLGANHLDGIKQLATS